ncbi:MAG: DoxX family membrane protein [Minisyncoccia bacterium]
MFSSNKYSFFFLRLGLAAVFLWFGVDKLVNPNYWLATWWPGQLSSIVSHFSLSETQMIYALGVFEILTGLSLLTNVFAKFFSTLAIIYLVAILIVNGWTEITVRDFGLMGGFLAIIFWPKFRSRF